MVETDTLLKRIDDLLAIQDLGHIHMGTLSLCSSLYGPDSPQTQAVKAVPPEGSDGISRLGSAINRNRLQQLQGILRSIRGEVEAGLVQAIRTEARGEILADFVALAKEAMAEQSKDVAAVLACAALEDALKRYAQLNNLVVEEKSMSEVVAALKSQGLVKGPQGSLLQSYTTLRNKAFHARWDAIDSAEVQSVIAFVEQLLLTKF
jgi:hypothetical protein